MTAENQNEGPSQEARDERNLRIQGSADDSINVLGDQNTIQQGVNYYTTNVFGSFKAKLGPEQLKLLRKKLLKQMKTDVAQRLEDSLHNLIRVDLEQEEQRYQVGRPRKVPLAKVTLTPSQASHELIQRELAVSNHNQARESIPPAEQTYNIFNRSDIGRRLLILGEPGSGKTTELLLAAQRLVEEAIEDDEQPIPLIFELSSWEPNTPFLPWLGQQLQKSYGVSQKLAKPLATQWVQQTQILPLLDGLDELGQLNQVSCINALEDFLALHPALSVLICCRREEYEKGGEQLKQLNGAIYLLTVGPQQIKKYLKDLGREQLWQGMQAEPEILKLAQSPLFLTMLVIAYQGQSIRDTTSLFNAYIQKQLHDASHQGTYMPGKGMSPQQTLHYLGWLAKQLQQRKETEFLIENLQPNWLKANQRRLMYKLSGGLFVGPTVGLFVGLFVGLTVGLTVGLSDGLNDGLSRWLIVELSDKPNELIGGLSDGLIFGLTGGLIYGLSSGLIVGLIVALLGGLFGELGKIEPKEQLKWSLRNGLSSGLSSGLIVGLIVGPTGGLFGGLTHGLSGGLIYGLSTGLMGGLIVGISSGSIGGLTIEIIEHKQIPNQGIKKSLQNGIIGGLTGWLIVGLSFGLMGGLIQGLSFGLNEGLSYGLFTGLFIGLFGGLFGGLLSGLNEVIKHLILRIFLTKNDCAPWNYTQFLEHAAQHRFIQRTGGRYRFIHDLLREHFAQMTPQQQALLAQPPRENG